LVELITTDRIHDLRKNILPLVHKRKMRVKPHYLTWRIEIEK